MSRPDLRRLQRLLEQERLALRRGDLAGLEWLQPHKRALLDRIEATPGTDAVALAAVHRAASRNARLYEALLRGLAEARALLGGLRTPVAGKTYARDGVRMALEPAPGSLLRKA